MAEDLNALGLIAHSYDSLFSVRKRVRKINDIHLPTRRGIGTNQIGAWIFTFLLAVITFGLLVVPFTDLLGITRPWWLNIGWIFGIPTLAAQRVAKPMPYGKSIPGTMHSLTRFYLDDRVHRRGLPVPTPPQPREGQVLHYQREWVMSDPYAQMVPGEGDYSDEETEGRIGAQVLDLQPWYDEKARQHLIEEKVRKTAKDDADDVDAHFRRGRAATVFGLDDEFDVYDNLSDRDDKAGKA